VNLPQLDMDYLASRAASFEISTEANMICVVIHGFSLPSGYDRTEADLLLRLSPSYPDVAPDMWWFNPGVRLADGRSVQNTECTEQHLGRSWQRWSRHFSPGQWRSGIDCLESFLALIRKDLEKYAPVTVR